MPHSVTIPNNSNKFDAAIFAVGKYGAGAIIGGAGFMLFLRVDDRAAAREDKLLDAYKAQTEMNVEVKNSIQANTEATRANTEVAREIAKDAAAAHRR